VTTEESPTQGGYTVTNSPDFIFLLIHSPNRSASTACLPENWQENEGRRMSSLPCRYLFRLQTRLPTSGDSAGRRVPYRAQQNPAARAARCLGLCIPHISPDSLRCSASKVSGIGREPSGFWDSEVSIFHRTACAVPLPE